MPYRKNRAAWKRPGIPANIADPARTKTRRKYKGLVTHALRMAKRGEHHFIMDGYAL